MTAIPKISAAVMRERMVERARRERIPLQADIEIIATCNFKCVHCYIAPCAEREDVMSLAQAEVIFDKLQAAGTQMVLLTGGEVFTHKQFREIYLSAKRHGFEVYINTNAYLIG
jgi:MoaA/NifB/PqqE/SkfB family radical SAM enzyme